MRRRDTLVALCSSLTAAMPSIAQPARALEIGLLPNISARVLLAQYQPMREFLARELKREVQVSTAPDWPTFHARTVGLEYDLTVTAAHMARLAQVDKGLVPLLSYAPRVRALLVTALSRPLRATGELSGQTIVLSNPSSLVTLRSMQWLADQGLQRERDFKAMRTPTDDSAGNVLLRGDARAAIVSGGEFRAIPEAVRAQLAVHQTIAEVASFVVLASPRLTAAEQQRLRQALLQFAGGSDEGKAFFAASGFTGIGEVEPGLMESMDPYLDATRRLL